MHSQLTGKCKATLVAGGAGCIRWNFVVEWIGRTGSAIILDLLTYAGNLDNLDSIEGSPSRRFVQGDICDAELVGSLLRQYHPQAVVHFAAESHVDRSIIYPDAFVRTNVQGTLTLLNQAKSYWLGLSGGQRRDFRFLHVSTDDVYGSLGPADPAFSEYSPYAPHSPYAASKARSDHLVRSYFRTHGFPTLTTNCSNNYGPFQFPEKLMPLVTLHAIEGKPLPVYGDGQNVRDWLFVGDHCATIRTVLEHGRPGETYNVGGNSERANLDVVKAICSILDEIRPYAPVGDRSKLIQFVPDRPGHDRHSAIDVSKIAREMGWQPTVTFEEGLRRTMQWYLDNGAWVENVRTGAYREGIRGNYEERVAQ